MVAITELNHYKQNEIIQETISEQIKSQFPIVGKSKTLHLLNAKIKDTLTTDYLDAFKI